MRAEIKDGAVLTLLSAEIQSHPAQSDTDFFRLLLLPQWEFLLFTTEQKLMEVIHEDHLSHGGNELSIIYDNLKNKTGKYQILLGFIYSL